MGRGCIEKSLELPKFYRKAADLTGAHFLDAAGCEFNGIDVEQGVEAAQRVHGLVEGIREDGGPAGEALQNYFDF